MSSLKLYGSTSGYVEIVPPAVAGNNSVTIPNDSGTLVVADGSGNLNISGIVTATSFSGDGSALTGVGGTSLTQGNTTAAVVDTGSDGRFVVTTEGSERLRIDSAGRIATGNAGFSTASLTASTTQYANLHLIGGAGTNNGASIFISRNTPSTNAANQDLGNIYWGTNDGAPFARIGSWAEGTPTGSSYPGYLSFQTTNSGATTPTSRVRLTSLGFLKCSPRVDDATHGAQRMSSFVHEFTCDNNDWVMQMTHTSGSAAESSGLYIKYRSTTPNNTGSDFFYAADATTVRAAFKSNGGLYNYSGNNSNLCDEREKKNIVNLDSTWDCLKHWELKKFHYNDDLDTDDLRYGVIAQQIAEYCPEVITDWIKPAMEAVLDEEGNEITPAREEVVRIGVKEQQMYWMAIKALQEAQERIETLEAEVAALKNQ